MKKGILGIVLVLVFFSCKDAHKKQIVKTAEKKIEQTVPAVDGDSTNEVTEEEEFKKDFDILLPRSYRTYENVNDAASLNEKWAELYEENGEYYIGKAKFKIEKGFDDCTGDSTKTILPENKTLIFINNPELKNGKVKSLKINKKRIWPGEKSTLKFDNTSYVLRAEGKVNSQYKVHTDDDKEEIFKEVEHYKLYLTAGNTPEKLILTEHSFNDTFTELLFAGDLDGDGKLDFIFGSNRNYEEERVLLFLSSPAANGEAVKKVSEIAVQFDC